MTLKKKNDSAELKKLEELIIRFGNMKTMQLIGYVSVAPIYSWRKTKSIPHWAKDQINKIHKEKLNESN